MVCSLRAFQSTPSQPYTARNVGRDLNENLCLAADVDVRVGGHTARGHALFHQRARRGQGHGAYHRKHRELHQPRGSEPRDDERSHRPGGKPDATRLTVSASTTTNAMSSISQTREEIVNAIMCLPAFSAASV